MPVRKLRSLDEAAASLWRDPEDPALWRDVDALWRLSRALAPQHFPPGVHKHRSLSQAQAWVEALLNTR